MLVYARQKSILLHPDVYKNVGRKIIARSPTPMNVLWRKFEPSRSFLNHLLIARAFDAVFIVSSFLFFQSPGFIDSCTVLMPLQNINQASKEPNFDLHAGPDSAALAPSAASLVLDQTVWRPVDTLHAKDHYSPVRRLGPPHRHVHLGSLGRDRDSHLSREVVVGRGSGQGSRSQMTGEEGIG